MFWLALAGSFTDVRALSGRTLIIMLSFSRSVGIIDQIVVGRLMRLTAIIFFRKLVTLVFPDKSWNFRNFPKIRRGMIADKLVYLETKYILLTQLSRKKQRSLD